ncbi:MAG: glycosyltransferase family 4 protein, partial [Anaerolineae bacterium]|nr:glycosyltransferase family 4 protein [Anaerolineae bacterium]
GIGRTGGGRSATLNLLEPLLQVDTENEYLVFLEQPEPSLAGFEHARQMIAPVHQRFAVRAWAQATWPGLLRREKVRVMHHTKNLVTLFNPCPSVVTIHDLTILVHPEIFPKIDVLYWRSIERFCVQQMERVIAVSDVTAHDLMRFYGTPQHKISVIYEGIDDLFKPASADEIAAVRAKYGLPASYLLHVGSISPKKNLVTLARAYARLARQDAYSGALALVGRSYWKGGDEALDAYLAQEIRAGQVVRTGPVPQADLPALYSGADCFVFPSLHEGFGLVPLESLACGVPVIASRVGMLEHMLGDVAVFLDDPLDDVALAEEIAALVSDQERRAQLARRGLELAPSFSRSRAALKTRELYKALAGEG